MHVAMKLWKVLRPRLGDQFSQECNGITEKPRGATTVQLTKEEGVTLGIVIAGGIDKGFSPRITSLRLGSLAHRSDALAVGDQIVAVNGIRTSGLKHEEMVNLLKNVDNQVVFDVEYELPDPASEMAHCICQKVAQVSLEKEGGSLGFTLRGGVSIDQLHTRPLVITYVRPGGPADREGTMKAGDRLLAINGVSVQNATLSDAQRLLSQSTDLVLLTIEYDISILETVSHATGPLLVEIDNTSDAFLGVSLSGRLHDNSIIIQNIKPASIAERCGALHAGDQILAVDGTRVDGMTPAEVAQLLKASSGTQIQLEILPLSQMTMRRMLEPSDRREMSSPPLSGKLPNFYYSSPCASGFNTLNSHKGKHHSYTKLGRPIRSMNNQETASLVSSLSSSNYNACSGVCHSETLSVVLQADQNGYGFSIQSSAFATETSPPIISNIDPGGSADKCGCLQVGDRILRVNNKAVDELSVGEVTQLLEESKPYANLDIEFDVAESVVPSTGVFAVKLAKRGNGLGITITASKSRIPGEHLVISDIRRGSVAHRTGTIQPGDKLLAIDSVSLDHCSLEDAAKILQNSGDVVKLQIQKGDIFSEESDGRCVVYTVELNRCGGPLGVTIAGTEDTFDSIIISGLTEGGLAEQTGALHIGDRLLAINGKSLRVKPLSEAILMLQNSGDCVTLKIGRRLDSIKSNCVDRESDEVLGKYEATIPSIDSAVESWDSSVLDPPASVRSASPDASSKQGSVTDVYTSESATVKRKQKITNCPESLEHDQWENCSQSSHSMDSGQSDSPLPRILPSQCENADKKTSCSKNNSDSSIPHEKNSENTGEVRDIDIFSKPDYSQRSSTLPNRRRIPSDDTYTPSYSYYQMYEEEVFYNVHCTPSSQCHIGNSSHLPNGTQQHMPIEIYQVTLFKDRVYEDFGFSVSDGLYERGVYINRIRKGGPADLSGILKPYDRILQVNDTRTHDFDCCLTVPLIASAGDKIDIMVARNPYTTMGETKGNNGMVPWIEEEEEETEHSTAIPSLQSSGTITKTL